MPWENKERFSLSVTGVGLYVPLMQPVHLVLDRPLCAGWDLCLQLFGLGAIALASSDALEWSRFQTRPESTPFSFLEADDVSQCYADFWKHAEDTVRVEAARSGKPIPDRCFGRGQRTRPGFTTFQVTPLRVGRAGDVRPSFLGFSHVHRLWFRQLRRLESFCRLVRHGVHCWNALEHRAFLWTSILNANGFRDGFLAWWVAQGHAGAFGFFIPEFPPLYPVAQRVFDAFQKIVGDFESHLKNQQRYKAKLTKTKSIGVLYKEVRRDPPEPVSVLVSSTMAKVVSVDEDTQALEFESSVAWREDVPIRHQGRDLHPIVVSEDKVWCDTVAGVVAGDTVVQTSGVGRLRDVFEAFHDQWKVRWLKHQSVEASQWSQILAFADASLGPVVSQAPQLSVASLRSLIKLKPRRSASGLDGVSVLDLKAMDDGQLQSVLSLFARAEFDGIWPKQCMAGSVQSLAKIPDPQKPGDYRPVTVLGLLYRLWSSCHSRHWLHVLSSSLDQHLCGNRPGHCPADVWRVLLNEVTEAHATDQLACGFVVDLVKAYNTLPRYVVLYAAKRLGVAQTTLVGWSGALASICRHFAVRNSFSEGLGSTTGLPEGCGLSCLGMLVLDVLLHRWMVALDGTISTFTFVDNWEVLLRREDLVDGAYARLETFVRLLDLELDTKKTFFWSTSVEHRARLRLQGKVVLNTSKDLGAHMAYTKQLSNQYLRQRVESLDDFWDRLFHAGGSHLQKTRVLVSAAWPRAFHACSAAVLGRRSFDGLRTNALRALRLNKPGASSWLQFACESDGVDPLLFVIWSTLRDYRAQRSSCLDPSHDFVDFGASYCPGSVSEIVVQRIHMLGWHVVDHSQVRDRFGVFDLREIALQELSLRVHDAWTQVVAQKVAHRVTLRDYSKVDRRLTRQGLLDFSDYDQGIIRRHLNGTQITNASSCFWSESGSACCQFCGCLDSEFHRLWVCPASANLRELLPPVVRDFASQFPQVLSVHGWTLASPFYTCWTSALLALSSAVPRPLSCLVPGAIVDLFVDGSCLWQDQVHYRLASWAVVRAAPLECGLGSSGCVVLAAEPLAGLVQSSYRAELMALRAACHFIAEAGVFARVWTDCLSVLSRFRNLTQGTKRLQANSPHADLWTGILESVRLCEKGSLEILKVPAHKKESDATSALELWMIQGNAVVDSVAKQANMQRPAWFWNLWQQHSSAVTRNKLLGDWVRNHIVQVATLWTEKAKEHGAPCEPVVERRRQLPPKVWLGVGQLTIRGRGFLKLYGQSFQDKVVHWFDAIWDGAQQVEWYSFAQLYVLFQLQTGLAGVVRTKGRWFVLDHSAGLTPEQFKFSHLCKGFRLMIQALLKAGGVVAKTCTTRPCSQYLMCHVGCLAVPLRQELHEMVELWLSQKLHKPLRGCSTALELPLV